MKIHNSQFYWKKPSALRDSTWILAVVRNRNTAHNVYSPCSILAQAGDSGLQDWFIHPVDYCNQISGEILMMLISISVLTGGLIKLYWLQHMRGLGINSVVYNVYNCRPIINLSYWLPLPSWCYFSLCLCQQSWWVHCIGADSLVQPCITYYSQHQHWKWKFNASIL